MTGNMPPPMTGNMPPPGYYEGKIFASQPPSQGYVNDQSASQPTGKPSVNDQSGSIVGYTQYSDAVKQPASQEFVPPGSIVQPSAAAAGREYRDKCIYLLINSN